MPGGSYLQSCSGCAIIKEDGFDVLSCECSKTCGALAVTKYVLDGSCRAFGNRNGELFCDKEMENDENIPKGSYQKECGGCSYDETTRVLSCKRCFGNRGEALESSLKIPEQECHIMNVWGKLQCREPIKDTMADENAAKKPDTADENAAKKPDTDKEEL